MFKAVLFVIALNWNKLFFSGEWVNKVWCIHTVEHYSAIQEYELLIHATTWMTMKEIEWKNANLKRISTV